jgi:hypothetical protein
MTRFDPVVLIPRPVARRLFAWAQARVEHVIDALHHYEEPEHRARLLRQARDACYRMAALYYRAGPCWLAESDTRPQALVTAAYQFSCAASTELALVPLIDGDRNLVRLWAQLAAQSDRRDRAALLTAIAGLTETDGRASYIRRVAASEAALAWSATEAA